jgi:hypothetical protein
MEMTDSSSKDVFNVRHGFNLLNALSMLINQLGGVKVVDQSI